MQLFNTLTKKVEDIKPQQPPTIKVYTCGPTVYDHSHVGHWYNYVRMDLLIRTLLANGLQPDWVMNITDVGHLVSDADEGEDKLEAGARREGKSAWEIAEIYTTEFIEGMKLLNISNPSKLVKATDHIEDQIEMIKLLKEKGYTYKIDDGIYYDTSKFPKYKDFANLDLDEQQSDDRIIPNPQKRQQADFALWKFSPSSPKRDMEWDSPWGKGFPGWHIECSAMCRKYLGDTLDIHTGGIDHIPVHHTNEIAQSEAVSGKPLALHWMHSNHVTVNGQKISKSLNNGITLEDIKSKGFNMETLRINILESNYRSQAKFSWDSLEAAKNRLDDLIAMSEMKYQTNEQGADYDFTEVYQKILDHINSDLNTPMALAELSELSKNILLKGIKSNLEDDLNGFLDKLDNLLGLELSKVKNISQEEQDKISEREQARRNNDYDASDNIRNSLLENGIIITDESFGQRWHIKTKSD